MAEEMQRTHYVLQALLYCLALPATSASGCLATPQTETSGQLLYLFVRGMAGAATPAGAGVFTWTPPSGLVPSSRTCWRDDRDPHPRRRPTAAVRRGRRPHRGHGAVRPLVPPISCAPPGGNMMFTRTPSTGPTSVSTTRPVPTDSAPSEYPSPSTSMALIGTSARFGPSRRRS